MTFNEEVTHPLTYENMTNSVFNPSVILHIRNDDVDLIIRFRLMFMNAHQTNVTANT